ncbi:MAG: hypothetical protein LBI14_08620 [Treponema sp.]|jgi:hypothetical protein|nr:hypothetical protein [Treponema sp.]
MTAEVAILNSQGAAIAADSAVTIRLGSGETKIYYTAEKIFNISEKIPIGIMIYNTAEFMGINWKLIIKEYSSRITDKDKFKKLEDLMKNFIKFLSDFEYEYIEYKQLENLDKICKRSCSKLIEYIRDFYHVEYADKLIDDTAALKKQVIKFFSSALRKRIDELKNTEIRFPDFSGKYIVSNTEFIKSVVENELHISLAAKQLQEFINLLILEVKLYGLFSYPIDGKQKGYSGVVFVGYGEEEIFPSICSVEIFGKLGVDFLYNLNEPNPIINDRSSIIYPFAQDDVINTFIRGIDPDLQYIILPQLLLQFLEITGLVNEEKARNDFVASFVNVIIEEIIVKKYRDPILDIVASLPTINLAEMAEALINITSLRRHNSTDQDTVGGPTDVAIISKVDGFVWVKRKNNLTYQ